MSPSPEDELKQATTTARLCSTSWATTKRVLTNLIGRA